MRKQVLNDYFGFNKQQRRGLVVLCILSFLLLVVRIVYPYFMPASQVQVKWIRLGNDSSQIFQAQQPISEPAVSKPEISLHTFNPNTASLEALMAAGFPKKQANNLVKFRAKGFVVREKKDLLKVYGITPQLYAQLENYIVLDRSNNALPAEPKPAKAHVKIEVNSADTALLESLPGIGPAISKRIVKYRSALGGFYSLEQLKEVYGINADLYNSIEPRLSIDTTAIHCLYPNMADFKSLSKHPYIGYDLCKKLLALREKESLTAAKIQTLMGNDAAYARLRRYLAFAK